MYNIWCILDIINKSNLNIYKNHNDCEFQLRKLWPLFYWAPMLKFSNLHGSLSTAKCLAVDKEPWMFENFSVVAQLYSGQSFLNMIP